MTLSREKSRGRLTPVGPVIIPGCTTAGLTDLMLFNIILRPQCPRTASRKARCTYVHEVTLCTNVHTLPWVEWILARRLSNNYDLSLSTSQFNSRWGYRSKSRQRTHGDLNGTITRSEIECTSRNSILWIERSSALRARPTLTTTSDRSESEHIYISS